MICKCKNCGAAVTFRPESGMVECQYCKSTFNPNMINGMQLADSVMDDISQHTTSTQVLSGMRDREKIACNIYRCTACGAELAVNRVESSTYCAYCGQPTIVFSRVSKMYTPDYIIPFMVSQKQAENIMRSRLNQGFFVPNEIKNFSIDKVRGIYIPYWMYDMHYSDVLYLHISKNKGSYNCYRDAMCDFKNLIADASARLNDETTQRLEPFDMRALKPFNSAYLTGFYSDCYDMNDRELSKTAYLRAKQLFDDEIKKEFTGVGIHILDSKPRCDFYHPRYLLLPAWFLSFHYRGEAYTMLVNGQTGKLVGTVPTSTGKSVGVFLGLFVGISVITVPVSMIVNFVMSSLMTTGDGDIIELGLWIFGIVATILFSVISLAFTRIKQYKSNLALTKAKNTYRYAKERQDS